jgi:hypothetical protein
MSTQFSLTEAEQAFVVHLRYELFWYPDDCPAMDWMKSHQIHWDVLAGFQHWHVMNDPDLMDKIAHPEKLPPFQVPWQTLSELCKRVDDSLVAYPDLRSHVKSVMKELTVI